jgi:hypothetical protein
MATTPTAPAPLSIDFSQPRSTDSFAKPAKPNYGALHALDTGFVSGQDQNMTSQSLRAVKYWKLKTDAETSASNLDPRSQGPKLHLEGSVRQCLFAARAA